jgi:type IV secretion system protein VirD4
MMYQSVGQLEKHFGKEGATSWFEGAAFASYAAIKSRETAEHLSKQIGDVTVEVEGRSTSTSWMDGLLSKNAHQSARLTNSVSLQKRPLLMPHEIREMRADEQIILVRGYPALRTGRAIYFRRPEMAARTGTTAFAKRP